MLNKANLQDQVVLAVWSEKVSWSSITTPRFLVVLKELWLMCLTGWWNCDETMGFMEPQAVLSGQGWVEGDGPSSSKKCLFDKLRCEQLSLDHQDEMRGRVECHQHSSDMKSHVSEWQNLVMPCRQRRWSKNWALRHPSHGTAHLSKIPWMTYLRGKTKTTGVQLLRCPLPIGLIGGSGG